MRWTYWTMSWAGFIALTPLGHPFWRLQPWEHRLVNSKPYASYCLSLRPSSLRSFTQIRFNSACVFADVPCFRPYMRPCLLLQSWCYSGLSCHLQHLWSWRHAIWDWYFPEVHAENPGKSKVVINGSTSSGSTVVSGVSQGTILGPILFLMFIKPTPHLVFSSLWRLCSLRSD